MAKKNSTDAESSAYRDTAFELAVKNKEKREIIVNSDKPYLCPKCGIAKHPSEFGKQYMKNYIVGSYLWLYQCKACKREKIYAKRLSNRSTQEGALEVIYKQILQSARQRDLSCDLTEKDIQAMWDKQDGKCYYSGYPMEYNFVGSKPGTFSEKTKYQISMDRKNNAIGYLKSNCILCCTFINKMKGTLDDKEFVKVCKDIIARS